MAYPNLNEEKKFWKQGYECVVGLDEAGRGPLAGPVVAAAVMIRKFEIRNLNSNQNLKKVNDSKKLTVKKREELYELLTTNSSIVWAVGVVSEKIIDKINILQATKLAMAKALRQAQGKQRADFLLIDGNFGLQAKIPQKSIVKGDQKVFSIAAASIIAKVTRDRLMEKMHKKFPQYNFAKHKGYGTAAHLASLEKFGPSKIHRRSFYPVRAIGYI